MLTFVGKMYKIRSLSEMKVQSFGVIRLRYTQPRLGARTMDAKFWGHSSVGRAPALQAGGRQFESDWLHQDKKGRGMKIPFRFKNK